FLAATLPVHAALAFAHLGLLGNMDAQAFTPAGMPARCSGSGRSQDADGAKPAASSARLHTPVFANTDATWRSTVRSERCRRAAMAAFDRPCSSRANTSRSRAVNPRGSPRVRG